MTKSKRDCKDEDAGLKWIRLRMDLIARVLGRTPTRAELLEYLLPELQEIFGWPDMAEELFGQQDKNQKEVTTGDKP
jgi:hypothetical protein